MNLIQVSLLVSVLGMTACKTSEFRDKTLRAETSAEKDKPTPKVTSKVPPPAGPTPAVITTSTSDLQLNQTCDKPVQLLMSQVKLSFPETRKCAFNEEPNKGPVAAQLQAHKVSNALLKLPESSEICSMTLESPADAQLQYDDFFILTIDDFIIFSSNKDLTTKLDVTGGFYKWDFLKVREMPVDFNAPPYCVGAEDRCKFPVTDLPGSVLLKLNYSEIAGITKAIQGKVQVPVDIVTTGDDDDSPTKMDCFHTALDLTVTMNYIKKPK